MTDDTLLSLLRAPAFVERALRKALGEMLAFRREFRRDCDVRSFVKLALAASRTLHDRNVDACDSLARHELEAAIVRAAASFAASTLGTRLRTIAIDRILPGPQGIDLAVFDRHERLHYVRLEAYPGTEARLDAVARAVRAMDAGRVAMRASLHFFSLRDGTLRSYPAPGVRRARKQRAGAVAKPALSTASVSPATPSRSARAA